jgi:hypothetical protein
MVFIKDVGSLSWKNAVIAGNKFTINKSINFEGKSKREEDDYLSIE